MRLAQILECNDTLGTCCNDYALVSLLDTVRKMLNLFQILIPIILTVSRREIGRASCRERV